MRGNARQIAAKYRRIAQAIPKELGDAEKTTAQETLKVAQELSSGTHRARRGDHPYARRRPHPPAPPYLINIQTGQFLEGWKIQSLENPQSGKITHSVVNATRQAAFFTKKGTRTMIGRPIASDIDRSMPNVLWFITKLAPA